MIGYSKRARTRYHKERGFTGWAQCHLITLTFRAYDENEDAMKAEVPHLSRCPECWR